MSRYIATKDYGRLDFDYVPSTGFYQARIPVDNSYDKNVGYSVMFDGQIYKTDKPRKRGGIGGNAYLYDKRRADTGEPFFLDPALGVVIATTDGVHTVSYGTVRTDDGGGLVDLQKEVDRLSEEIDDLKESGGTGNFGSENSGKLLGVGGDGNISKVQVGDGLTYEETAGKNIFHGDWAWGRYTNGVWVPGFAGNMEIGVNEKFPVTPGATYAISITKKPVATVCWPYIIQYDSAGRFISNITYFVNFAEYVGPRNFTVSADTAYIAIYIYGGSKASVMDNAPEGLMIEKGIAATEYEPYKPERTLVAKESDKIPSYYYENGYIQDKASRIAELYDSCAGNGDAFFFFTDQHWPSNAQHSPALIRYVAEKANVPRLFCGGDMDDDGIDADILATMAKEIGIPTHHAVGNHEYASATNGHMLCRVLDAGKENQVGNAFRHYYYVDNRQQKIRYIVLNGFNIDSSGAVASAYEADQATWLTNEALKLDADWTVVVFTHALYWAGETDATMNPFPTGANEIIAALDAAVPDVACVFMGHLHLDRITHTPGRIPVVATTCDKYAPWIDSGTNMEPWMSNRVKGTITEQAIDAVVLDKATKTLTIVRIGAPADNWTDGTSTGTVEERVVTY